MNYQKIREDFKHEFLNPDNAEYIEILSDWWEKRLAQALAEQRDGIVNSLQTLLVKENGATTDEGEDLKELGKAYDRGYKQAYNDIIASINEPKP